MLLARGGRRRHSPPHYELLMGDPLDDDSDYSLQSFRDTRFHDMELTPSPPTTVTRSRNTLSAEVGSLVSSPSIFAESGNVSIHGGTMIATESVVHNSTIHIHPPATISPDAAYALGSVVGNPPMWGAHQTVPPISAAHVPPGLPPRRSGSPVPGGNNWLPPGGLDTSPLRSNAAAREADASLYARTLAPSVRAYPLWTPGPTMDSALPEAYRRRGTWIGDVGRITGADGAFSYRFSILHPSDHLLNIGQAPRGFTPFTLNSRSDERLIGADFFATDGVAAVHIPAPHSKPLKKSSMFRIRPKNDPNFIFELIEAPAAICVLPSGGRKIEIGDSDDLVDYVREHALQWYSASQCSIPNGVLHVVTGVTQTRRWGNCVLQRNLRAEPENIVFNGPDSYWQKRGVVKCQSRNPDEPLYDSDTQNQTVFFTGFRIELVHPPAPRSGMPDDRADPEVLLLDVPDPSMVRSYSHAGPSASARSSSWSGRHPSHGGPSSARGGPESPRAATELGSAPSVPRPSRAASGSQRPSDADTNIRVNLAHINPVYLNTVDLSKRGITKPFENAQDSKPFHPLDVLHNYLRNQYPRAKLIITHDKHWVSVLNEDESSFPEPDILLSRITSRYKPVFHNGIVHVPLPRCKAGVPGLARSGAHEADVEMAKDEENYLRARDWDRAFNRDSDQLPTPPPTRKNTNSSMDMDGRYWLDDKFK